MSDHLQHSTLTPRGQPLPKTVRGKTRADERDARVAADARDYREVCRLVDLRDHHHCRACGRRVTPGAVNGTARAEHHHLTKRSQGGQHTTCNLLLLCTRCHEDIHVRAVLALSGDADARDERGRMAGVRVERLREHGWEVAGWV